MQPESTFLERSVYSYHWPSTTIAKVVEKFKDHNGKWGIPYETKNGQKRCYFAKYSDCKDTANPADIVCNAAVEYGYSRTTLEQN